LGWVFSGHRINSEYFSLSLTASYDESLGMTALLSLTGHTFLILSQLIKIYRIKFWLQVPGIMFLWIAFYYLSHNLFSDTLSLLGFLFGIPFLICSGILFYKITKQKKQNIPENFSQNK
jgi:hypothetical protein